MQVVRKNPNKKNLSKIYFPPKATEKKRYIIVEQVCIEQLCTKKLVKPKNKIEEATFGI